MKITDYITRPFNYRMYRPAVENKTDCVLFFHGIGERGPADGSEIWEVEKNSGWPKFAKGIRPKAAVVTGTVEYPFNIIATQIVSSYEEIMRYVVPWVTSRYGYKNIVLVGISMGNYALYDMLRYERDFSEKHIKGFVACCGAAGLDEVPKMEKLQGLAWHGTIDDKVKYYDHKTMIDAYNAAGGKVEFISLDGVRHDAWNHAFKSDPTADRSLQFVNQIFAANKIVPAAPSVVFDPVAERNKVITEMIGLIEGMKK